MKSFCAIATSSALALTFALSSSAFALTYGEATTLAKTLPEHEYNGTDHGKLCEVLGQRVMQELRPNAEVLNGVIYKKNKRIVGELDLVIKEDGIVTEVIEVKCMVAYRKAVNKANEQLDRFSAYIGRCDVDFSLAGESLPCDVFGNPDIKLTKMSYKDATSVGFEHDLNFTRKEILQLVKDAQK